MKIRSYCKIKSIISTILIFSAGIFITACDTVNESENSNPEYCLRVIDDLNNNPLDSVHVQLTVRFNSGVYRAIWGYTDASGICCIEYDSGSSPLELYAEKKGYVRLCSGYITPTIRLTPAAYIKFHIQNITPAANTDWIGIWFPSTDCGGSSSLVYEGANINETLIIEARPGNGSVTWRLWHNNVPTDSTLEIYLTNLDTTFCEILY